MEIVLEFLLELVIQLVFEVLVELGVRRVPGAAARPPRPWLAALGYALLGGIAGGLSLLVFPKLLLTSTAAQYANVLLSPLAAGAVMASVGAWRRRREQRLIPLDTFAYAWLFALAMAIVRLALGA